MIVEDIVQRRLRSLRLEGTPLESAEAVVRWLGAVQSQDYAGGKWSVAQRAAAVRDADVDVVLDADLDVVPDADLDAAYARGSLLRTHVLRSTWHFVLPADIRWLQELTAPRVHALNAFQYRQMGLDEGVLRQTEALIARTLEGGRHLTRKELQVVLGKAGFAVHGLGLAYVVMSAELNGVICSGVPRGKQHTYALLDERAPRASRLPRNEALAELTRRYFLSHGPATARDFRWWSSLSAADSDRGLDLVKEQLGHDVLDGVTYWFDPSSQSSTTGAHSVFLLQGFDEYFVGYSESKFVLDRSGAAAAHAQNNTGVFTHGLVIDGQVAGRWKRTLTKDTVVVEIDLFEPLDNSCQRALKDAVEAYGRCIGLPAVLRSAGRSQSGR